MGGDVNKWRLLAHAWLVAPRSVAAARTQGISAYKDRLGYSGHSSATSMIRKKGVSDLSLSCRRV